MTIKIGIFSGKGGVGKTLTSINLASAINTFGRDVILVDANVTTPNIGILLGFPILKNCLQDVLSGKKYVMNAVYQYKKGFKIIPSSITNNSINALNLLNMKKALYSLDGLTEYVIVDGSAGLSYESIGSILAIDEAIIVCTPDIVSLSDALKTIRLCEQHGKKVRGIVINKAGSAHDLSKSNIEAFLERPVIGLIPDDSFFINEASIKQTSVVDLFPKSKSSIAFKKLAAYLINHRYEENEEKNFLTKIKEFFRPNSNKNFNK